MSTLVITKCSGNKRCDDKHGCVLAVCQKFGESCFLFFMHYPFLLQFLWLIYFGNNGYYRNTNARPIWPVSSGRPSRADIPKCSHCSGSMCCEFQILPQLLYYLGVDNEADSMDWASIVVYTCEASCDLGVAYEEEYAWVQLYLPSPT